jgi:hypothetical protein
MGVNAVLRPPAITVDPGREARCQVVVRNTGSVVDQFLLMIKGEVGQWVTIVPERLNLLPSEEAAIELVFAPPRTHEVLAGEYPFALRVVSREDDAGSVVNEGVVTVTGFISLVGQLVPHTTRSRRKGRTTLAIDNSGNYALAIGAVGHDPDDLLDVGFRPRSIVAEPGTATFIKVKLKPHKYFWKGSEVTIGHEIIVQPEFGEDFAVVGAHVQRPLLPRRTLAILPLLMALVLILLILVTTLRQASPASMAGPSPAVTGDSSATSSPSAVVTGAPASPPSPTAASSKTSATAPVVNTPNPGGPVAGGDSSGTSSFTVSADAYPGVGGTYQLFDYAVPAGSSVQLTAVKLEDGGNDTGTVEVRVADQVLLSQDLAGLKEINHPFGAPRTLNPGDQVVLAVDCRNTTQSCRPTAVFSADSPL